MRQYRNATPKHDITKGWTKAELLDAAGISSKTFDMIRKAARVRGPAHGGLSYVFSADDVTMLVHCAGGGRFTERGAPAATAWRALLAERQVGSEHDESARGKAS